MRRVTAGAFRLDVRRTWAPTGINFRPKRPGFRPGKSLNSRWFRTDFLVFQADDEELSLADAKHRRLPRISIPASKWRRWHSLRRDTRDFLPSSPGPENW